MAWNLELESRNWEEIKLFFELDVYKLVEELSDMMWHDFDKWNKSWKAQPKIENAYQQHKSMKAKFLISNFNVP